MIEICPREDEPTYEELEDRCERLKGKLYEARRSRREAAAWNGALLAMFAVSTVLLALTWSGCIRI